MHLEAVLATVERNLGRVSDGGKLGAVARTVDSNYHASMGTVIVRNYSVVLEPDPDGG